MTRPKHSAVMGGSSAARVIACPGSVALNRGLPPEVESEYAAKGTALHEAASHCLMHSQLPSAVKGQTFYGHEMTAELIHEKLTPAIMAIIKVAEQAGAEMDIDCDAEVVFCPGEHDRVEHATADWLYGEADVLMRVPGSPTVYIADFKFGDGVPVSAREPSGKSQLMFYAGCGLYTKGDPRVEKFFKGVTKFVGVIIQPGMSDDEDYTTVEFGVEELEQFLDTADAAAQTALTDPNAPRKTGDHCRWCKAKTVCPEQMAGLSDVTALAAPDVNPIAKWEQQQLTPVKSMSQWLEAATIAEDMIKALRDEAVRLLEMGETIEGWQLKPTRATRKWNSQEAAEQYLLATVGGESLHAQAAVPDPG